MPHANSTAWGRERRSDVTIGLFPVAHDLVRKPVPTFRDHALTLPVQHADQGEQPARGVEIDRHLVLEPLHQDVRSVVVDGAPPHVDGLDLVGRRGADSLIIAVADQVVAVSYTHLTLPTIYS